MKTYTTDTPVRERVYFWLAVLSMALAFLVAIIFGHLLLYKLVAPSAGALFGIIAFLFDRYLWKIPLINACVGIPDLSGEWVGTVTSEDRQTKVSVTVTQTFHRISLVLRSDRTYSESDLAGFRLQDTRNTQFVYTYLVEHSNGPDAGTPYGKGTNRLFLKRGKPWVLSGPYYSSMSRNGHVELTRMIGEAEQPDRR